MADFETLLTKIAKVFKKDIYILNGFCIAGQDSLAELKSLVRCRLSQESLNLVKEVFPDEEIIYISDVKKAKADLNNYTTTVIPEMTKKDIIDRYVSCFQEFDSITEWDTFNFSEEKIKQMFGDNLTTELFEDNDTIPTVIIGASLFPLATEKNINDIYYHIEVGDDEDKLNKLYTVLDTDWSQLENLIMYIE